MRKNFICLRNCKFIYNPKNNNTKRKDPEYHTNYWDTTREFSFQAGMAYIINISYILGDKDELHEVNVVKATDKFSTLIHGYASTKFIYKNFILEDDYFCINRMFYLLLEMNLPISDEDAKIMRESLIKNSLHKKS